MKTETVVTVFLLVVIGSIVGASVYQSVHKPACTYTYDLQARIIKATCPIRDAGLYALILVNQNGVLMPEPMRVADLKLKLVTSDPHEYVYTFKIVGNYPPGAWVVVDFDQ